MPRRHIGTLAASVAVLFLLALPAAALASGGSYGSTVLKNACSVSGGAHGYGKNVMTVRMDETGLSGVAQFHARATEQEYVSGTWHTIHDFGWAATGFFSDTAKSHSWTYGKRYDFRASDAGHRHRMVIKMIFGNGTAYPTATKKSVSRAC